MTVYIIQRDLQRDYPLLSSLCYLSCLISLFCSITILGIDEQLARHYAHLFIRDPLTLFHEHIYEDDEQNTDHFEVTLI